MKKIHHSFAGSAAVVALFLFAMVPAQAQQAGDLSDTEVASVAVAANQIDIDYAKIALKRSKNQEVINFAKTMQNDHEAVIKQAVALVTKLGVTPKHNSTTAKLQADAAETRKHLNAVSPGNFDKAYVDNEVAYHKAVISAVENLLIPASENAELKALLESIVPALKAHLEHAEMVQAKLAK